MRRIYIKLLLTLLIIIICGCSTQTPFHGWKEIKTPYFTCGDIDFTISNHELYVAFQKCDDYRLQVIKYDGSNWKSIGKEGFSNGQASNITLTVDNGVPYVAYFDAFVKKGIVMKYNGQSWERLGKTGYFSNNYAFWNSIAVKDGKVYTACNDCISVGSNIYVHDGKVTFTNFDNPELTGVINPVSQYACLTSTSLAIVNGNIFLAFDEESSSHSWTTVFKNDNGTWTTIFGGSPVDNHDDHVSLSSSEDGALYLAYYDNGAILTVKKYLNDAWEVVGETGITQFNASFSLAVYNNQPYLAFYNQSDEKLEVMTYNGTSWVKVGNSLDIAPNEYKIGIDSDNGDIYIVAYIGNQLDYQLKVEKFIP